MFRMGERLSVGLDFGTSNSAIATVENDNIKIFETREGQPTQPSSIFIRVDGYISVGNQAIKDSQNPEKHTDTHHFIPSIKPGFPIDYYEGNILRSKKTYTNGELLARFFSIEELGGSLIADLKNRAEQATGLEAQNIVLGRPIYFSEDEQLDKMAQNRLASAARNAGFREIQFMFEPVAAALYYQQFLSTGKPRKIFVFDFGGGTLDVSILNFDQPQTKKNLTANQLSSMVLGAHGIDLGGTDLDKDIFRSMFLKYFGSNVMYDEKQLRIPAHLHQDVTEWHLQEHMNNVNTLALLRRIANDPNCSDTDAVNRLITLVGDQRIYSILRNIETAKFQLSTKGEGQIQHEYKNIQIDQPLSRKKFEAIIRSRIDAVQECVDNCLRQAQITPQEIDVILKVGGSSNNLFVGEMLGKVFPGHIRSTEIFTSVVSGLAIAAKNSSS